MKFNAYIKSNILLDNLQNLGYKEPTEVQREVFDHYKKANDLLIIAPTGTGKTEAYSLPVIQELIDHQQEVNNINILIIVPTRELAIQTQDRIGKIIKNTPLSITSLYGGQSYEASQSALSLKPTFVVSTLGRLIDVQEKGWIDLKTINHLILDEVDELFNLGFQPQLFNVLGHLNQNVKKWVLSATINSDIRKLANKTLVNPIEITIENRNIQTIEHVLFVDKPDKKDLILHLVNRHHLQQIIVFTRTTHGVDRIEKFLQNNNISCTALYGDKKQSERQFAIDSLIQKKTNVLIATDIATRGIDIPSLEAIINYEIPDSVETYIHRIGRSTRGFEAGLAFTFCDHEDNEKLIKLQASLGKVIPVEEDHPFMLNWQRALLKPTSKIKKKRK